MVPAAAPRRSSAPLRCPGTRSALVLGLCALGAAAATFGEGPSALRAALAAPLVLGGAALPWLVRATPSEPSALKLWVFGALFSTPLLALLLAASSVALGPGPAATAAALVGVAALQGLGVGRSIGTAPLGRAAWLVVGLAALTAAGVAAVLFGGQGAALLTRPEVLWHAGVADRIAERGLLGGLEHPWLAGAPLPTSPAVGALAAAVVAVTGLAAPAALGALTALAAGLATLFVYLVAAPVWREPRRELAAVALAFIGWNALGGLWPLAPIGAEGLLGDWSLDLAARTPHAARGDVHYAGSAWLVAGALPLALAYGLGALAAGVHAVRHGERPWPLLAALAVLLTALVQPVLGTAVGAALLLAALVAGGTAKARFVVPLAVGAALVPALASVARHGLAPEPATPLARQAGAAALAVPAALLVAPLLCTVLTWAVLAWVARRRAQSAVLDAEARALFALLAAAALAPPALWGALPEGRRLSAALGAQMAFPLAVLAAGALGWLASGGVLLRVAAAACALPLVLGGARATWFAGARHAGLFDVASPLRLAGERTVPRAPVQLDADVARCYEWIALHRDSLGARAVLVRSMPPGGGRVGGPTAPHVAALATGLPLWWDAPAALVATTGVTSVGDTWQLRGAMLTKLFTSLNDWDVHIGQLFRALDRPLVFVVDELDRRATSERGGGPRGVDSRLLQLGAREVFAAGDASVLWLAPEAVR